MTACPLPAPPRTEARTLTRRRRLVRSAAGLRRRGPLQAHRRVQLHPEGAGRRHRARRSSSLRKPGRAPTVRAANHGPPSPLRRYPTHPSPRFALPCAAAALPCPERGVVRLISARYNQQQALVEGCIARGVRPVAFSPLGSSANAALSDPAIGAIAERHSVSAAQVVLQWNVQRGVTVIPHTLQRHEVLENLALLPGAAPPTQAPHPAPAQVANRCRCAQARSRRTTRWAWRSPTPIWRPSRRSTGASASSPSTGVQATPGNFSVVRESVRASSGMAQRPGRRVCLSPSTVPQDSAVFRRLCSL